MQCGGWGRSGGGDWAVQDSACAARGVGELLTLCASAFLRSLYWVNRGEKGARTIEAAGMDGSDRKVLAAVHMEEPVGLTLDYVAGRLYWISEYKEVLERGQEEKRFSQGLVGQWVTAKFSEVSHGHCKVPSGHEE